MKVFVTGVKGQLGYDVVNELEKRDIEAVGVDIQEMDITDRDSVNRVIRQEVPDAVIHCAAYTAVDAAEENEELCRRVNAEGTRNIAEVCKDLDIKMIYISTDYVFSGQGERPWEPEDEREPQSVYGQTKYEGELAVQELLERYFIVRIAWVFGVNGKNFIKTMLKLSENHDMITVVNDQFGSPTYTYDLARLLVDMVQTEKYGIYHATNEGGYISWYDFTREIFRQAQELGHPEYSPERLTVTPVRTEEYGISKARRPFNSRLAREKLIQNGFLPLPTWQDALARYLKEIEF